MGREDVVLGMMERSIILGITFLLRIKCLSFAEDRTRMEITVFLNWNHPAESLIHSINVSGGITNSGSHSWHSSHGDESGKGSSLKDFPGWQRVGSGTKPHLSCATEVQESEHTEEGVGLEGSGRASLGRWCLNWS